MLKKTLLALCATGAMIASWTALADQPINTAEGTDAVEAKEVEVKEVLATGPHALVESMTSDLLTQLGDYREGVEENPEPFFQFLETRLDSVIDFPWIARNVMGPYRKRASNEQLERFSQVFRRGLVETYGRGLLTYSDEKIEVLPPAEPIDGKRRVRVKQEIHGETQVYPVSYTMGLNRNNEWKITNVIINGINIGKTFRNQFVQSAQKHGGDLDKVIDGWASEV